MTLINMKSRKTLRNTAEAIDVPSEPHYPYGLRIELNEESLGMLGMDADEFMLDEKVEVTAHGKVVRVSKSEHDWEGEVHVNQCVEIQITHLEVTGLAEIIKDLAAGGNERRKILRDVVRAIG